MRLNTVFLHFRHLNFSKLLSCQLSLAAQFKGNHQKRIRILLKRRKSVTGARSMASRAKVICGSNTEDSKKSKQQGRSKRKRKRIRRIKREKEKPTKT